MSKRSLDMHTGPRRNPSTRPRCAKTDGGGKTLSCLAGKFSRSGDKDAKAPKDQRPSKKDKTLRGTLVDMEKRHKKLQCLIGTIDTLRGEVVKHQKQSQCTTRLRQALQRQIQEGFVKRCRAQAKREVAALNEQRDRIRDRHSTLLQEVFH